MKLFDDYRRTDGSHSPESEPVFTFLNRSPRPDAEQIRVELERWFDDYPDAHQHELRQAFRSPLNYQFHGAFWELYLYRLLTLLDFDVEVHPDLEGVRTRPDFRVKGPRGDFLMEAATTESGIVEPGRNSTREGWVIDALNACPHPNYFVSISFHTVGRERPSKREIVQPVVRWLDGLDPDKITRDEMMPSHTFSFRDWEISLMAWAKPADSRGVTPDERLIFAGPATVGSVNDSERLLAKLRDKSGKYGTPDLPIVVAVNLISDFQDDRAAETALFGHLSMKLPRSGERSDEVVRERDGFWMRKGQPLGTRVSAVLAGMAIVPWTIGSRWPMLWRNPWASHPLELDVPLPLGIGNESGRVSYVDATGSPAELFGLADNWPEQQS